MGIFLIYVFLFAALSYTGKPSRSSTSTISTASFSITARFPRVEHIKGQSDLPLLLLSILTFSLLAFYNMQHIPH